jgi:ABC-type antimicrobial peptide transport system permease subunit
MHRKFCISKMENSKTEQDRIVERQTTDDSRRSPFFSLWISWQELQGRRVIFFINVLLVALLIALPVSLDLIGKARKSSVETRVDYIGPSLILVPKGILSSDLVAARMKGRTFPASFFKTIQREFSGFLRDADVMLTTRLSVGSRDMTATGIDFRNVHSYPFARYSIRGSDVLLGAIAAEKLKKNSGDTLQVASKQFTIAGVIPTTGEMYDASVFFSLPVLQEMTDMSGRINEIRLFPVSESSYQQLRSSLNKYRTELSIIDAYRGDTAEKDIDTTLINYQKALYTVAFILIAFCIMISTYINLDGRKAEVSTMHTLGTKQWLIFQVLTFRTVWITLLGSLTGQVVALFIAKLQDHQIPLRFIWSTGFFIEIILATIMLGMLVTIPFAVYTVYRRDPVTDL